MTVRDSLQLTLYNQIPLVAYGLVLSTTVALSIILWAEWPSEKSKGSVVGEMVPGIDLWDSKEGAEAPALGTDVGTDEDPSKASSILADVGDRVRDSVTALAQ